MSGIRMISFNEHKNAHDYKMGVTRATTSPPPFGGGVGEADGGGFTIKQKYSSKARVTKKPLSVFRYAQNHFPREGDKYANGIGSRE